MRRLSPSMDEERSLYEQGYRLIAGVDEAGRGAWAGDVVAAAVILPAEEGVLTRLQGVRDSKQLTPRQRWSLYGVIRREAVAIGVGRVAAPEIDRLGIAAGTRQAMALAIADLGLAPDFILIDAVRLPDLRLPQKAIVRGDARCLSIAAASIVAKVSRDMAMVELDALYPGYGFARHKGYGTAFHRRALHVLQPCPIHRFSYAPVRALVSSNRSGASVRTA